MNGQRKPSLARTVSQRCIIPRVKERAPCSIDDVTCIGRIVEPIDQSNHFVNRLFRPHLVFTTCTNQCVFVLIFCLFEFLRNKDKAPLESPRPIWVLEMLTVFTVANSSLSILRNSQFSSMVTNHGDLAMQYEH